MYKLLFLFLFIGNTYAQNKYTLSGFIKAEKGEELTGANVIVRDKQAGAVTNYYGFYSLTLPAGEYEFEVSFVGYKTIKSVINLNKDIRQDFKLSESNLEIESVKITAQKRDYNIKAVEMSVNELPLKTINKLPNLLGETDLIKTIQLLPGVIASSEVSGGFHVRGGSSDQNLILLDKAHVYNASHAVGFLSVFNPEAIKDIKLYKGGIPAEYGGRLSSVLDIHMKEGNPQEYHGLLSIGAISSKLNIEGPIVKDKSSFLIAGRRTYADLFLPFSKDSLAQKSKVYFYDLNAKINYAINEKNRIFFSTYFGRDVVNLGDLVGQDYGNYTTTLRWSSVITSKFFLNTSFIYSNYNFKLNIKEDELDVIWKTGINDLNLNIGSSYYINHKNTLKFGGDIIRHEFTPGSFSGVFARDISINIKMSPINALEYALYLSHNTELNKNISLEYGIRYSIFQNIGKGTSYVYDKTNPDEYTVVDSNYYSQGTVYNTYANGLEPRIGLRFLFNDKTSLKLSYNRMYQYLQIATNTASSMPMDFWFPSSPNIKPQRADQVAMGVFRNFLNNMLETSVEVYYKDMKNTIDFKDHADLRLNKFYEGEVRAGNSYAYGAEFLIKKQEGDFTGWISYTYSRSIRVIPEINNGVKYNAAHDKPHDIAVVIAYDAGKRWNYSMNWIYTSAEPRTFPDTRFEYGNSFAPRYNGRNTSRVFPYHRLDLSATVRLNKVKKRFEHLLNISVYNAYMRSNPIMVTFEKNQTVSTVSEGKIVYLYSIVPSVSYTFKF